MTAIRHEAPEALRRIALEELLKTRVARFGEIPPDWDAFADSQIEGRRRAQHRFIGGGGSGKSASATPEEVAAALREDLRRFAPVVKHANVTPQ